MEAKRAPGAETIAVVGAGIAGICAAYLLSRKFEVTLFEKNERIGGHTNTRTVRDAAGNEVAVDTGFIVCNDRNYPNFYRFLEKLGVPLRNSDMSFSVSNGDLHYLGPALKDFLARPGNLLSRAFLGLIAEQRKFNRAVLHGLASGTLGECSVGEYVEKLNLSGYFVENYLTPLIGSIWSSPDAGVAEFPLRTLAVFFKNHGMLELSKRPTWQTVVGGSQRYLEAFHRSFRGTVRSSSPVLRIIRDEGGVEVELKDGRARFDHLVLAAHADEALRMLERPSPEEAAALGSWRYTRNLAVLHTDRTVMRGPKRMWASWNYKSDSSVPGAPLSITYYMNRLQGISGNTDFFVTLNPSRIAPETILYETEYHHPVYNAESVASQAKIREINGRNRTHYCGAYLGYGFHEDGVNSALDVARSFGVTL